MIIKAANDFILLKEVPKEERTIIHLPAGVTSGRELSSEVKVMKVESIGPTVQEIMIGDPMFEEGDVVLVASYAGTSFAQGNDFYIMLKQHEILAKVE